MPNVLGKSIPNVFQNQDILDCGHENPLRKSNISEKNGKMTNAVSRLRINTDTNIEKKITAKRNGVKKQIISIGLPIWGSWKNRGIANNI